MLPRLALATATAAIALGLAAATPGIAEAWTEASVRTVRVHVDVDREARALVAMRVTVRIHGGWLEQFELAGLDPDLVLDEAKPPSIVTEEGEKLAPRVTMPTRGARGRIQLAFSRREAPRRGTIFIDVVYRTSLAHRATEPVDDHRVRVRWTLPAWQNGLDGVVLHASAPVGADFANEGDESAVEHEQLRSDARVMLSWKRVHLPRTMVWTIAFDVPEAQMAAALQRARPIMRPHPARRMVAPAWAAPGSLAAIIVVLAFFARLGARRRRGLLSPLVPMPELVRFAAILALGAMAVLLASGRAWLVLGALSIVALLAATRGASPSTALRMGSFRSPAPKELRRARWARWLAPVGLGTPLDATTFVGLSLWAALGVGWAVAQSTLASDDTALPVWALGALAAPIFLTGTRMHRPLDPFIALARLSALGRSRPLLAARALAQMLPALHERATGQPQEARLVVRPHAAPPGLHRLDLAIAHLVERGVHSPRVVLLAVAESGSEADRALSDALADAPKLAASHGDRVARIVSEAPLDALGRALRALEAAAPAELTDATLRDASEPGDAAPTLSEAC